MTFNEYTGTWFKKLSNTHIHKGTRTKIMDAIGRKPNRDNLRRLHTAISEIENFKVFEPLSDHILAANARPRQFGKEFRFTFSRTWRDVSVVSELFSMVRQAMWYNDNKNLYPHVFYSRQSPPKESQ